MTKPWARSRSEYVSRMFGTIAEHYDLMNFVMTLGQDQRWRRQAAEVAALSPGQVALDVATGTGDLAFELARHVGRTGHVVGLDFAEPMLELAGKKAARSRLPVSFEQADALHLPYGDASFDAVACAFGLRNFDDRPGALAEMTRVVRPGRRVVILELTPPSNALTRAYVEEVIPRLGELIAGAREAYTYLPESVGEFPDAQAVAAMMQAAGLHRVTYRFLNFRTIALHWGTKPG